MGYDITALDEQGNEVAYIRAYMGAFRMLTEQGYDWFTLIDANDCDGGVSGNGDAKMIKLANLRKALDVLNTHDPQGKLAYNGNPAPDMYRDEFSYRKPLLAKFMGKCIKYCEVEGKDAIKISFS